MIAAALVVAAGVGYAVFGGSKDDAAQAGATGQAGAFAQPPMTVELTR